MAKLSGFSRRLLRDRRGNVLLIGAASMLPLLGMLGGAFDMARAYLVRTRLQQACDAAVLAGRLGMGAEAWSSVAQQKADRYFQSNFRTGQYGSTGSRIIYEPRSISTVHATASASVPMLIMKVFGFGAIDLQASCDAQMELPNADIMFVLDTTLSMAESNPGDSISRIAALRSSVQNFYTVLQKAKGSETRLRYGFVPYASTVNVGTLLKPDWLVSRWTYQSRVAKEVESVPRTGSEFKEEPTGPWTYVSGSKDTTTYTIPAERCTVTSEQNYKPYDENRVNNPDGTATWTAVQIINNIDRSARLSGGACTVTEVRYKDYVQKQPWRRYKNPDAGAVTYDNRYWWDYAPVEYALASLRNADGLGNVSGGEFTAQVANNHQMRTISWTRSNACIEERQSSLNHDAMKADPGFDLDVDTVPIAGDAKTQWRPALPGLVYSRKQWNANDIRDDRWGAPTTVLHSYDNYITPSSDTAVRAACPTYARKLSVIDATTLSSYLASLKPAGLTYHDVGFLWGLRLLSAQGLFASENQAPLGSKLARHLIFMTDGQTETHVADYDAYGLSALDRRRTPATRLPTAGEQNSLVEQRLGSLCLVAKAKGVTVWVIAFGTSLTPLLSGCATQGHAFEAKNAAELEAAFSDIAKRISHLRLVR
ncbi:TadE/TadG family type IV pilus assembly protein [Sphingomonas sp. DT-51]|uniref:TadE/TadG family type IV pilus assembly protein n=1 Tax=Sphingomonas sp. DT-51 TaxID=3396165 RepID=UPI003F1DB07D